MFNFNYKTKIPCTEDTKKTQSYTEKKLRDPLCLLRVLCAIGFTLSKRNNTLTIYTQR